MHSILLKRDRETQREREPERETKEAWRAAARIQVLFIKVHFKGFKNKFYNSLKQWHKCSQKIMRGFFFFKFYDSASKLSFITLISPTVTHKNILRTHF